MSKTYSFISFGFQLRVSLNCYLQKVILKNVDDIYM